MGNEHYRQIGTRLLNSLMLIYERVSALLEILWLLPAPSTVGCWWGNVFQDPEA